MSDYSNNMMGAFDEADYLAAVRTGDFSELLAPQRQLFERLRTNPALRAGDPREVVAELTEAAARMLDVSRVGLWRLDEGHRQLECLDLYEAKLGRHESGALLPQRAAPRYFAALAHGEVIAAGDAFNDPRTAELGRSYLMLGQIGAVLDTPVVIDGQLHGVLCHEHVGGSRQWRAWERTLAASLADCAGLVFADRRR